MTPQTRPNRNVRSKGETPTLDPTLRKDRYLDLSGLLRQRSRRLPRDQSRTNPQVLRL
jgi:hypothetical protein